MNASGFSDDNDSTIATNRSDVNFADSIIYTLHDVIWYLALALGIPGNILSAIVWLRRRFASNSSAVYLAALAINDLAFLIFQQTVRTLRCSESDDGWFCICCLYLQTSVGTVEPLLVLGFSVDRLIAILRPLQVCYITLESINRLMFVYYGMTSCRPTK